MVGVPACRKEIEPHWYHTVGEKYIDALAEAAGVVPLLLPAFGESIDFRSLLGRLDGLYLTGSISNVEPHHYGGDPSQPGTPHDADRDATTLPLINAAVDAGVPLFAICRGYQEMNVAFGGTLYQRVHEVEGMLDHREPSKEPLEVQYGPSHDVRLAAGGMLERLAGASSATVNSLHGQGVESLGNGLVVEATASDGLIEAFRVDSSASFSLAVQWHPEWQVMSNPLSRAMFAEFGDACCKRAGRRVA